LREIPKFGLRGTTNLTRVAVSLESEAPLTIIGYIREVGGLKWVVEGDHSNRGFDTPREAAEHGYAIVWRDSRKREM
jgi:hypothetical protein